MATYDIEFSETLISAAWSIEAGGMDSISGKRAVLYLSLLSIEIALKSLLEMAGVPVSTIRSRSHDLARLMDDICFCEVEEDIGTGTIVWVSAARLRSITISEGEATTTLGTMLDAGGEPTSRYPNEIRYGDEITHYWPSTMLNAADALTRKIKGYDTRIRIRPGAEIR